MSENLTKAAILPCCLLALATIVTGGCLEQDDNETGNDLNNAGITKPTVSPVVAASAFSLAPGSSGLAAIFSDDSQSEYLAIDASSDANGNISHVNRYLLSNNNGELLAELQLGSDGLPERLEYNDGYSIEFDSITASAAVITVKNPDGTITAGPLQMASDFSAMIKAAELFTGSNPLTKAPISVYDSVCDFVGGCDKLYWFASKTLDVAGCVSTAAAAASTGGLTIPLAYWVCGSTTVSIASDLAASDTGDAIYDATGMLSSDTATAGNCIYTLYDRGALLDCVKGVGERLYWIYDKAYPDHASANALFPDNCLTGQWQSRHQCQSQAEGSPPFPGSPFDVTIAVQQDGDAITLPSSTLPSALPLPTQAYLSDQQNRGISLSASNSMTIEGQTINTRVTQNLRFYDCTSGWAEFTSTTTTTGSGNSSSLRLTCGGAIEK